MLRNVLVGVAAGLVVIGVVAYAVIYCCKRRQVTETTKGKQVHVSTTSAQFKMPNSTVLEIEIPELPADVNVGQVQPPATANTTSTGATSTTGIQPRLVSTPTAGSRQQTGQGDVWLHGTAQLPSH